MGHYLTVRPDGRVHSKHHSSASAERMVRNLAARGVVLHIVEGLTLTAYRAQLRAQGKSS